MHKLTKILFDELKLTTTVAEFKEKVTRARKEVRSHLEKEGLLFIDDKPLFSQDLVPGQNINGKDLSLIDFYDEVNYIRYGLTIEWYSRIDQTQKFSELQKLTQTLIALPPNN